MTRKVAPAMFLLLGLVSLAISICPVNAAEPTRYSAMPSEHVQEVMRKAVASGEIPKRLLTQWNVSSSFYASGVCSGSSNMLVYTPVGSLSSVYLEPRNLVAFVPALATITRWKLREQVPAFRLEPPGGYPPQVIEKDKQILTFLLDALFLSSVDFGTIEGTMFIES